MITKLKHLIPILLLALCILAAPAAAAGGAGTASSPYIIQTPAELQSMANDLSAYYVLGNDIDMSGYSYTPVGTTAAPFFGSLDGRGHTIRNLVIDQPDTSYVGLFGVITMGTIIKNLNLEDCTISGSSHVGTLYGHSPGITGVTTPIMIDNINVVDCTVTGSRQSIGGVCGTFYVGTLSNCNVMYCDVSSSSSSYVGGIYGFLSSIPTNATTKNCMVVDSTVRGLSHVGGIAGYMAASGAQVYALDNIVRGCVIHAPPGNYVGGIAGYMAASGVQAFVNDNIVENCIMRGYINIGGIAGHMAASGAQAFVNDNIVENCTVRSDGGYAGGIAGGNSASGYGSISGCSVANTTILAPNNAAGICASFIWT